MAEKVSVMARGPERMCGGLGEFDGLSRLMMWIKGVRPDAAPEGGRRRMLMVIRGKVSPDAAPRSGC